MKRYVLIGVTLMIFIFFVLIVISEHQKQQDLQQSKVRLQNASIKSLESLIDLYHVEKGEYPRELSDLENESYVEDQEKTLEITKRSLTNLEYSVRGDGKAYKITFTDLEGKKQEIERNYDQDFH